MAVFDVSVNEGAGSSSADGYLLGGANSTTAIHKIAFSTESLTSNLATMSFGLKRMGSASGPASGTMAGGVNASDVWQTAIKNFTFSTEVVGDNATALTGVGLDRLSSNVASATHAYFSRGRWSPNLTGSDDIHSVVMATGVDTIISAFLGVAYSCAGYSSVTKGYLSGGFSNDTFSNMTTIVGITFASEARTTESATLAVARNAVVGLMSTTNGYTAGGVTGPGYNSTPVSSEIDGIVFATGTANNPSATLSTATTGHVPTMSLTKGYLFGGTSNISQTFTFGTETSGSIGATFSTAPSDSGGMQHIAATPSIASATCDASVSLPTNNVYGDAAADTTQTVLHGSFLPVDHTEAASAADTTEGSLFALYSATVIEGASSYGGYGWQLAGRTVFGSTATYTFNKLSFTTETMATAGTLGYLGSHHAATSNANFGILAGGMGQLDSSTYLNRVELFNFATEAYTNQFVFLPTQRRSMTGVGNEQYGYFGGGERWDGIDFVPYNAIYRVSYVGSVLTTLTATLSTARAGGDCGFQSSANGYFNAVPSMDKMSFSTETCSTVTNQFPNTSRSRVACSFEDKVLVLGMSYIGTGSKTVGRMSFDTESFSTLGAALATNLDNDGVENTSSVKGYGVGDADGHYVVASTETVGAIGISHPFNYAAGVSQKIDTVQATTTQDASYFAVFIVDRNEPANAATTAVPGLTTNKDVSEPANSDTTQVGGILFEAVSTNDTIAISQQDVAAILVVQRIEPTLADTDQSAAMVIPSNIEEAASAQSNQNVDAVIAVVCTAPTGADSAADVAVYFNVTVLAQADANTTELGGMASSVSISEIAEALVKAVCSKVGEIFGHPSYAYVTTFAHGVFAERKRVEVCISDTARGTGNVFINNDVNVNIVRITKKPEE